MSSVFRGNSEGGMSGSVEQTPGKLSVTRVLQKRKNGYNNKNMPIPPYPQGGLKLWIDITKGTAVDSSSAEMADWYDPLIHEVNQEGGDQRVVSVRNLITNDEFKPAGTLSLVGLSDDASDIDMPGGWTNVVMANPGTDKADATNAGTYNNCLMFYSVGASSDYVWDGSGDGVARASCTRTVSTGTKWIAAQILTVSSEQLAGGLHAGIALVGNVSTESAVRLELYRTSYGSTEPLSVRAIIHVDSVLTTIELGTLLLSEFAWFKVTHTSAETEVSRFYKSSDGVTWIEIGSFDFGLTGNLSPQTFRMYAGSLGSDVDEVEFGRVVTSDDLLGPWYGLGQFTGESGMVFDTNATAGGVPAVDQTRRLVGPNPFSGSLPATTGYETFVVAEGSGSVLAYEKNGSPLTLGGSYSFVPSMVANVYDGTVFSSKPLTSAEFAMSNFSVPTILSSRFDPTLPKHYFTIYGKTTTLASQAGLPGAVSESPYAYVGGSSVAGAEFSGSIYEVVAYDRLLTDDERAEVITILRTRHPILDGAVR